MINLKFVATVSLKSSSNSGAMLSRRTGALRGLLPVNMKNWIELFAHGSRNCVKQGPTSNSRVKISLMSLNITSNSTTKNLFLTKTLFIFLLAFSSCCYCCLFFLFLFSPLSPQLFTWDNFCTNIFARDKFLRTLFFSPISQKKILSVNLRQFHDKNHLLLFHRVMH